MNRLLRQAGVGMAALLFLASRAWTQAPVLVYSARVGPDLWEVHAAAVGADGSVYLAGRVQQGANDAPKLMLAKLSPDGGSVQCSMVLDGDAAAMTVADDGAVVLTGSATSPAFPVTTAAPYSQRFLVRADVCGQGVTYATWLPISARGVAVATEGATMWVATDASLLRYEVSAGAPAAEVPIDGIPGALAIGSGRLYVTGTRGNGPFRAFLLRLDPATMKIDYDVTWGDGPVAAGSGVAVQVDGSVWIAGPAVMEGLAPGANYSPLGGVPYWGGFAMLTRVTPAGTVAFSRILPQRLGGYNPSVGLGDDGRVWVAIRGAVRYPHNLSTSPQVHGVYLRSFDGNGGGSGGEAMIPCRSKPAVTFGRSGRVAVASVSPDFPLTPAAANSGSPAGATVVAADLATRNAPSLMCDRETLAVPRVRIGSVVYLDQKALACKSSDGSEIAFAASVVPASVAASSGGSASAKYSIVSSGDRTPASIIVRNDDVTGAAAGVLILLAAGVQGPVAVPLGNGLLSASPRMALSNRLDPLPGPDNHVLETALSLSWEVEGVSLPVPFRLTSSVPWLSFESSEGVAPAEARIRVNAGGLPRGVHNATVTVEGGGVTAGRLTIPITVGTVFQISGTSTIQVPWGDAFTHKIQIQSTGDPMEFVIDPPGGALSIEPSSGTTPAEIRVVFNPQGYAVGDRPRFQTVVRSGDLVWGIAFSYTIVPRDPVALSDSIVTGPGAPGKLLIYQAGGASRCEPAAPVAPPWPTSLGGCRLRVDGELIPLSSITEGPGPPNPNFLVQPISAIRAQLPYGISGAVQVELEDMNGKTTTLPLAVQAVAPEFLGIAGARPQELVVRKAGESIVLLMSGLGETGERAPVGDVPMTAIEPATWPEVFVGGRIALVLSAELSSADPGVFVVTAEIPEIAADVHPMVLRIGEVVASGGSVQVIGNE